MQWDTEWPSTGDSGTCSPATVTAEEKKRAPTSYLCQLDADTHSIGETGHVAARGCWECHTPGGTAPSRVTAAPWRGARTWLRGISATPTGFVFPESLKVGAAFLSLSPFSVNEINEYL